jgi:hypothetical protein
LGEFSLDHIFAAIWSVPVRSSDGSVHFLKASIGIRIFARLVTRAGGEVVSASDY